VFMSISAMPPRGQVSKAKRPSCEAEELGLTDDEDSETASVEEAPIASPVAESSLGAFRRIFKGRRFCPGLFVDADDPNGTRSPVSSTDDVGSPSPSPGPDTPESTHRNPHSDDWIHDSLPNSKANRFRGSQHTLSRLSEECPSALSSPMRRLALARAAAQAAAP